MDIDDLEIEEFSNYYKSPNSLFPISNIIDQDKNLSWQIEQHRNMIEQLKYQPQHNLKNYNSR